MEVRRRIAVLPGVEAVSWATKLPIGGRASLGLTQPVGTEPGAGPAVDGSLNRISPDYFRSMGIAVRRGRDFTDDDRAGAPRVAILNETMARGLFGTSDPIGQRFFTGQQQYRLEFEVVGIAGDSRVVAPGRPPDNALYVPLAQMYNSAANLHVRAAPGLEGTVSAAVRGAIRETSGSVPLPPLRPLADALGVPASPAAGRGRCGGDLRARAGRRGHYGWRRSQPAVVRQWRPDGVRLPIATSPGSWCGAALVRQWQDW
jgi:hypothetical protein